MDCGADPFDFAQGRLFGWLVKSRRLRLDYEVKTTQSEAMIQLAMLRLMLRRLASS